jgi:hypothetical protein
VKSQSQLWTHSAFPSIKTLSKPLITLSKIDMDSMITTTNDSNRPSSKPPIPASDSHKRVGSGLGTKQYSEKKDLLRTNRGPFHPDKKLPNNKMSNANLHNRSQVPPTIPRQTSLCSPSSTRPKPPPSPSGRWKVMGQTPILDSTIPSTRIVSALSPI